MPECDFLSYFLQWHNNSLSNKMCQSIKKEPCTSWRQCYKLVFLWTGSADQLSCFLFNGNLWWNQHDRWPGLQNVVIRKGCRQPYRIIDFPKSSTSLLFMHQLMGHSCHLILLTKQKQHLQYLDGEWTLGIHLQ